MTLPDERYRAVSLAREFLRSLLNPALTPKVPRAIRQQAYWVLKHYPADSDIQFLLKEDVYDTDSDTVTNKSRGRRK